MKAPPANQSELRVRSLKLSSHITGERKYRKTAGKNQLTMWTWKWIEYHLPSSEQSDYYNISVKKAYLNICHDISNRIRVTYSPRHCECRRRCVPLSFISHHIIMYHIFPYLSQLSRIWPCNTHSDTYCMQTYYFKQHIKLTKHSSQM